MYFGQQYLEESNNIQDGISIAATIISHLVKYESEEQQYKQSKSWVDTILRDCNRLSKLEDSAKGKKTNFINGIKKEYNGKVLSSVNSKLKHDNTGLHIDSIPDKYSYENITDRDELVKILVDKACTEEVLRKLENEKIDVPPEIAKRCKKY